jgi:hypothetical protein
VASKKTRQVIVLSAFAVAAATGPVIAATTLATSAPQTVQAAPGGECLAWFGNQEDGHCLGYSNGNGTNIGTPWGIYGPNNYQNGGLLPGQTFNRGFN